MIAIQKQLSDLKLHHQKSYEAFQEFGWRFSEFHTKLEPHTISKS